MITRPAWLGRALGMGLAVLLLACGEGCAQVSDISVPFELIGGRPHIQVYVNGRGPFAFVLDTGAQGVGRADSLLVAMLGLGVVGSADVSDGITTREQATVRIDSMRCGPITLRNVVIPARRYGFRTKGGAPLMGILGPGFFADFTFTIDYPRSLLRVSPRRLNPADGRTLSYERPFRVPITLGSVERTAHIDTGFDRGIHIPLADTSMVKPDTLAYAGEGETTQNRVRIYRGHVAMPVVIAGYHLEPIDALFTDQLPEVVLGGEALRHFVVSIDQRSRLVRIAQSNGLER